MEFSILLFDKEEGRGELTLGWSNATGGQVFFQEVIKFLLFGCSEVVGFTVDLVISWEEFDCVVPWPTQGKFVERFFGEYILIFMIRFRDDFFKCFYLFLFSSHDGYIGEEIPEVFIFNHE